MPAISLSLEPANISAIANDVGTEVVFLRQLIAHARPEDVAVGISTSGGSKNVVRAVEAAFHATIMIAMALGAVGARYTRFVWSGFAATIFRR